MLILSFLKPGFDNEENKQDLANNYFNLQNGIVSGFESEVQYGEKEAGEHYSHVPEQFKQGVIDYIVSAPVYGYILEYRGSEKDWQQDRLRILGATKEKDLVPECFRYQKTIAKGEPYIIDKNVIHSSDSYAGANKEILIYLDLVQKRYQDLLCEGQFDEANKILLDLQMLETDCEYKKSGFNGCDIAVAEGTLEGTDEYKTELLNIVNQYSVIIEKLNKMTKEMIAFNKNLLVSVK